MRVFCILLTVLTVVVILAAGGCTPASSPVPDFSYAEGRFTATVRGAYVRVAEDGYAGDASLVGASATGRRQAVAATVEVGPPVAEGVREMRVTFSEPTVLSGVTITREAGTGHVAVTWPSPAAGSGETLTFSAAGAEGLLRFAEALLPLGDIESISPVTDGACIVERRTYDGDRTAVFHFLSPQTRTLPAYVAVTTPRERIELYVE